MVEYLTLDWGEAGPGLTGITALCLLGRCINPSLVLVQPRKTRPYITERLRLKPTAPHLESSTLPLSHCAPSLVLVDFFLEMRMMPLLCFSCPLFFLKFFMQNILSETSKPPLDIFSYILKYMIYTWIQFTLNMEKSIEQNLSKFQFHKLKLTCSIDRLYKGTIAFHFHTNAKTLTHRLNRVFQGP